MTSGPFDGRWDEVERELDAVLDASPTTRSEHLAALELRDAELHAAVQHALAAAESDHDLLDRGAVEIVSGSFAQLADDSELDAGARVGVYRLQRRLGAGGMGEVWLADRADDEMRHTVAIKLLRPIAASPEGMRRFTAERQILAALRHPNIAQVVDAGSTAAGLPYLVLEYVDGRTLTEYCRDRHLDLEQRLVLFDQVLDAVTFAHRHLVVHRDLKPSNILVTAEGRVKLLDFGIAKLLDPTAIDIDAAPMTRTGLRLMTPEYAAPEQLRGEAVSTATDVWALGVLLHELLTGRRPFDLKGLSPIEIERMVCETTLRRPSTVARDGRDDGPSTWSRNLRGDLDTIVLKMLRREPEERYTSTGEVARDLERFRQGRPIEARPSTLGYRARKFVRRHRGGVAAAVLIVIAIVAGVIGTAWQTQVARREAARFEAIGDFLFDLFEGADPEATPGEQLTAIDLLDQGYTNLDDLEAGPAIRVDLLRVLGVLYGKLGRSERSDELLRQSLAEARVELTAGDRSRVLALDSLGSHIAVNGSPAEAVPLLREALAIRLRQPSAEPAEIAETMSALALALRGMGEFGEAEELLREAVEIRRRVSGDGAAAAGSEIHNLANLLMAMEQYDEARTLFEEVIETERRVLGPHHPDVATAIWNLAVLEGRIGSKEREEELFGEALTIRLAAYPNGHPDIARTLSQLARVANERGAYDEADGLFRQALSLWEDLYGSGHPHLANILANLATLKYRIGSYDEAAEVSAQALSIWRATFGDVDHDSIASGIHNLGVIERDRDNLTESSLLLEEAAAMRRRLYGDDHSSVGLSLKVLGTVQTFQGRSRDAIASLEEAVAILVERLGEDHGVVAHTRIDLAMALLAAGRPADALLDLEFARTGLDDSLDTGDFRRGEIEAFHAAALVASDRGAEAKPHLAEAARILGEPRPTDTAVTRHARRVLSSIS